MIFHFFIRTNIFRKFPLKSKSFSLENKLKIYEIRGLYKKFNILLNIFIN